MKSPEFFAWESLKITVFENGLLPSIRNEQVRKGPVRTFAADKDRVRKHVSNSLHDVNSTNLSSVVSTPATIQLETRVDDVEATIASLVEAPKHHRRGRSKTERRAAHGCQDNSVPRSDKSSSFGSVIVLTTMGGPTLRLRATTSVVLRCFYQ